MYSWKFSCPILKSDISFYVTEREKAIAGAVPAIEKARLYRGKGGEIMRSAVSRLIEFTAKVRVRLSVKSQKTLHDSLDENLRHPNSDIQVSFVALHTVH